MMNLSDWDKIAERRHRLQKIRSALNQLPAPTLEPIEVRFTDFEDNLSCIFSRNRMFDMMTAEARDLIEQLKALGVDANK